jgi:hypothetical protein
VSVSVLDDFFLPVVTVTVTRHDPAAFARRRDPCTAHTFVDALRTFSETRLVFDIFSLALVASDLAVRIAPTATSGGVTWVIFAFTVGDENVNPLALSFSQPPASDTEVTAVLVSPPVSVTEIDMLTGALVKP